jgi:hypothetical protein
MHPSHRIVSSWASSLSSGKRISLVTGSQTANHLVCALDLLDPAVGPLGGDAAIVVAKVGRLGQVDKEADLDDAGQELDVAKELRRWMAGGSA